MKIPAQTRLDDADQMRSIRGMIVPNAMTLEDLSIPGNWAHQHDKVRIGDEVIVLPEDRSWRAHLYVKDRGLGWVKTALLHLYPNDLMKAEKPSVAEPADCPDAPEGYTVNFAPAQKWRVMTNDPHMVVSKDHKTRLEATNAAIEHWHKAQGTAT